MMKKKILTHDFFDRSAAIVARDLLGKYLVRAIGGKVEAFRIVETESYEGFQDKASKAHRGQTPGNTPMFAEAGTIYVYFTYGMHWLVNIVCGKPGYPSAVLLRGVEGTVGPARLTKRFSIDKMLNAKMLGKGSGLWIEEWADDTQPAARLKIRKTPRIGIDSSGPVWSRKLLRFVLADGTIKK
jgi:DNA-3-methyladenine glycosylase